MSLEELRAQAHAVKAASVEVAQSDDAVRRAVLLDVAEQLLAHEAEILEHNQRDLDAYVEAGPGRDRLLLTPARVAGMAQALRDVAAVEDPLYREVDRRVRPNGLVVTRVRVPLGVVGVIYENRPNVTTDVAGLCVRSGNAAFLRGSASAQGTNTYLVSLWRASLERHGLPADAVALVADSSHETAAAFMGLTGVIDCLIPRGGKALIAAMREHARVPYVLDGDGNCHVYVDVDADLEMAASIIANAKMSRPGVCNAAETLLVHEGVAAAFLPRLPSVLPGVTLRVDPRAAEFLPGAAAATEEDFENEFLDLILAVKVVDNVDEAVAHVARYGTGHSEAIVTTTQQTADAWVRRVDAAAVLVNASTRFIDGGELGLGGEVGISTQKLHARGPMGVEELTCVKWVVEGKGQTR